MTNSGMDLPSPASCLDLLLSQFTPMLLPLIHQGQVINGCRKFPQASIELASDCLSGLVNLQPFSMPISQGWKMSHSADLGRHRGGVKFINSHHESASPQCIECLENSNEFCNYSNESGGEDGPFRLRSSKGEVMAEKWLWKLAHTPSTTWASPVCLPSLSSLWHSVFTAPNFVHVLLSSFPAYSIQLFFLSSCMTFL